MSENIGDTIPVLLLIGIIPYVGYVTSAITLFILYPVFINSAIKSCEKFRIKTKELVDSSELQSTEKATEDEKSEY